MSEKRFFHALFKTMLFFAFIHVLTLTVMTIVTGRFAYLNIFEISGLSLLFPGIQEGYVSFIISLIVMVVVYSLFYIRRKR